MRAHLTQVGVAHRRIGHALVEGARKQHGAEIHDHRPIDDFGDHGEVVLDQEDGRAPLALHRAEHGRHLSRLVQVEPRRRLVGQQDLGLGRQGPGQLDQSAVTQPERVDRRVRQIGDAHELERGVDPFELLGLRLAQIEEVPPQATLSLPGALRHHQMVTHRHVGEDLHPLVGAPDAHPGTLVGRHARQGLARRRRCRPPRGATGRRHS